MRLNERKKPVQLRAKKRRTGVALLEFALVLTMLLLLTLGLVQFAILANASTALAQVTREGARYAALNHTGSDSDIKAYVQKAAQNYELTVPDNQIVITRSGTGGGQEIKVAVTYDMKSKLFLPNQFKLPGLNEVTFVPSIKTDTASYMTEGPVGG